MTHVAKYIWEDEDEARRREAREERERREYRPSKKEERVEAYPWETQSEARRREAKESTGKSGYHTPVSDAISAHRKVSVYISGKSAEISESRTAREKRRTEAVKAKTARDEARHERSLAVSKQRTERERIRTEALKTKLEEQKAREERLLTESKLKQKRSVEKASKVTERPKTKQTKTEGPEKSKEKDVRPPKAFISARDITPKR